MKLRVNTHASVRVETENGVCYFDPFRIEKAVNDADIIFITHSHFDHFSPDDIEMVINEDTVIAAPFSMKKELEGKYGNEKVFLKPGERAVIRGVPVEAVPAYNTNKPMHKKEYLWLGYIAELEGSRIYVCGDTDATEEGKSVECDLVFVPAGGTYTMDAAEAADFVNIMKPKKAIPYHYGALAGKADCGLEFRKRVSPETEVVLLTGDR